MLKNERKKGRLRVRPAYLLARAKRPNSTVVSRMPNERHASVVESRTSACTVVRKRGSVQSIIARDSPNLISQRTKVQILHEPQLDTVLMVENAIRTASSYQTKKELWKSLPRQVQYQTFNRILDYLESSNKIVLDKRRIVWVFPDNEKLKSLLESSVDLR